MRTSFFSILYVTFDYSPSLSVFFRSSVGGLMLI